MKLMDALPDLALQIQEWLESNDYHDLADQIPEIEITKYTSSGGGSAIYIYLRGRPLNIVEQNIIGSRHGGTISIFGCSGIVNVDIDNFSIITGIELLNRSDIMRILEEKGLRKSN